MRGYSELNVFTSDEIKAWELATLAVGSLPEDPLVRCHELARAVRDLLLSLKQTPKFIVCDGKFGLADHTWLVTEVYSRDTVLDVYSVGVLPQVQLIDRSSLAIRNARQYIERDLRADIDTALVKELVSKMSHALKR
jgi:hypothetical protein